MKLFVTRPRPWRAAVSLLAVSVAACASAPVASKPTQRLALETGERLVAQQVTIEPMQYRGRRAVRVLEVEHPTADAMAIVQGTSFSNGVLELEVAGLPRAGAGETARGFIGIAFRVQPDGEFECFYIRPTNGRADDQERRNHSTQYISHPQYPWRRLRTETPGRYESYVDLEAGAWTRLRVEVQGTRARLQVNGSSQPVLIVNDLKHGERSGAVALWIGQETEGYFRDLRITQREGT